MLVKLFKGGCTGLTVLTEIQILSVTFETLLMVNLGQKTAVFGA